MEEIKIKIKKYRVLKLVFLTLITLCYILSLTVPTVISYKAINYNSIKQVKSIIYFFCEYGIIIAIYKVNFNIKGDF